LVVGLAYRFDQLPELVELTQLVDLAWLVKLLNQLTKLFDRLTKTGQLVRLAK
jgi:hypothetical protein